MKRTCPQRNAAAPPQGEAGTVRRRAAVVVESAVVAGVFLMMVLAMLDLSIAVLRHNSLSEASRRLGRSAVVHGAQAAPQLSAWGPATVQMTAADSGEPADAVRNVLVLMKPDDVNILMTWPDGDNRTGDRVTVQLTHRYQPVLARLFRGGPFELHAESTMRVQN